MKSVPLIRSLPRTSRFAGRWLVGSAALWVIAAPLWAEVPGAIAHQGRIVVTGVNFEGDGQFKFLLFADADADHANGNETAVWSNSSTTPAAMTEPASSVTVAVTKGLYGTWLGDTSIPNMAALPVSVEPGTGERLYLRIWFNDGSSGFQALAPDQTIAAVPFALSAAGVTEGGVTANALADGAVTSQKIAPGAVTGSLLEDGAITSAKLADNAVTSDKIAPGAVTGLGMPGLPGSLTQGGALQALDFDQTGLSSPTSVAVAGNFAYVVDNATTRLQIFNISNPYQIVAEDFDQTGLSSPTSVAVSGNFAYVVDDATDRLQVFDISDPGNIVAKDSDQTGLAAPTSIAVSGNYAYVVDNATARLQIFDISDPDNIVAKDFEQIGLSSPTSIVVSGNFAYVVDSIRQRLQIYDVSDPGNIVVKDFDQTGLASPRSIAVSGNFAYVVDSSTDRLQIFDVSDPDNIIAKDFDQTGLAFPRSIAVSGNFACVTDSLLDGLRIFDISDPDNIVAKDFDPTGLANPLSVAVSGNFAYVVDGSTDRLQIFSITGLSSFGAMDHVGDLDVTGAASVSGNLATSSSTVSGNLSAGSANVTGPLTAASAVVSGTMSASDFVFPSPKAFSHSIPGLAMLPQNPNEAFFRSSLGFIQLSGLGGDTNFLGVAPVNLPHGAKITGMDILYFDNSVANSFTNFTARLRRLPIITANASEQNIVSLDVPSPASPNNTAITLATSNSATVGREIVDNTANNYFVSINFSVTAADAELRFYGFRIRYTLETLAP